MKTNRTSLLLLFTFTTLVLILPACTEQTNGSETKSDKETIQKTPSITELKDKIERRLNENRKVITSKSDSLDALRELGVVPNEARAVLYLPRSQDSEAIKAHEAIQDKVKANLTYGAAYDRLRAEIDELLQITAQLIEFQTEISIAEHSKSENSEDHEAFANRVETFLKQNKPADSATP